jgi:hypothetical protein
MAITRIEQLKNGVRAMRNPLDNLHSNWAYMVMSSLAWTLKAWCGLLLPVAAGPWEARHREQKRSMVRMEFKGFLGAMMRLPAQIVRTGRRIIYRLMSWKGVDGLPAASGRGDASAATLLSRAQ